MSLSSRMLKYLRITGTIKRVRYPYSTSSPSAVELKSQIAGEVETKPDQSKIVASAFAALKGLTLKKDKKITSDNESGDANDVDSLLSLADSPIISRNDALKVVSVLADWASCGRVQLSDFESDLRFIKLCRILGKGKGSPDEGIGDLSLVLGVTGDDQAAKLISSISLSQMAKVISSLALKGRRSTPLLRSLAFNIGRNNEILNLKEASDILYACASLNFPEEVMLEKVSNDIITELPKNRREAVISSILTSLGVLKYRNTELLDALLLWISENVHVCRIREFLALFITLANVNYKPQNFEKFYENILLPQFKISNIEHDRIWIDVVWSAAVLNLVSDEQLSSVLDKNFVANLSISTNINYGMKLKLLNINGVATARGDKYTGVLLENNSIIRDTIILRPKEKQQFVDSVIDAVRLLPIAPGLRTKVNSGMGFLVDGEFWLDEKGSLIPVIDATDALKNDKNVTRICIMVNGYHDMCRGSHNQLTGLSALCESLLKSKGYKVLSVPHTEYNPKDQIISRVQYIEKKLKTITT